MRLLGRRQRWRSRLGCQPHRENRSHACERTTETFPFILFFRSKKVPPPRGITLISSGGCQRTCGSFLKPPSPQQRKRNLLSRTRSQSRAGEEVVQWLVLKTHYLLGSVLDVVCKDKNNPRSFSSRCGGKGTHPWAPLLTTSLPWRQFAPRPEGNAYPDPRRL